MVIVVEDEEGHSNIAATDSNGEILTYIERLDKLYDGGLHFEAAVSQMTIVEELLLEK